MQKIINAFKKFFARKSVIIVLSVFLALAAWFVVMESTNPVVEQTVNVNIEFVNFNAPAEKQLSLVSELGVVSAEVRVSGRQNLIDKLLPSDLTLTADFSEIENSGSTYISVKSPECSKLGINVVDYYPKQLAVSYDRKMELYLPVKVDFANSILKSGYEIISVEPEPDSVPMSGFESDLEGLEYISVNLSDNVAANTIESDKSLTFIGRFITEAGTDVTANFETEKITVKIDVAKRVPVIFETTGELPEDVYLISSLCSCESVLIDGSTTELIALKSITLPAVELSELYESVSFDYNVSDLISSQLRAVDGTAVIHAEVQVGQLETREFLIDIEDITQAGRNDDVYLYNIAYDPEILDGEGNIIVTIKGKAETLDELKVSTLKPEIEIPAEGKYRNQQIRFTVPEGLEIIGEYLVDIDVQFIPTPTPTATPTPTPTSTPTPTPIPTATGPDNTEAFSETPEVTDSEKTEATESETATEASTETLTENRTENFTPERQ